MTKLLIAIALGATVGVAQARASAVETSSSRQISTSRVLHAPLDTWSQPARSRVGSAAVYPVTYDVLSIKPGNMKPQ